METVSSLDKFFTTVLEDLPCDPKTRAYIVSIFTKYKTSEFDMSDRSITMIFNEARMKHDFLTYQSLGDWLFFCRVEFPDHLCYASDDYYVSIGRLSYYACYRLINRQWQLFERLADEFEVLEEETRKRITGI